MKYFISSLFVMVLMAFGTGLSHAADPMSDKEASPTLKERITKDTVKGTLTKVDGAYYWIKDNDGKQTKIHVDKSTKLDTVKVGDMVKAYINDQGHATTLQRAD